MTRRSTMCQASCYLLYIANSFDLYNKFLWWEMAEDYIHLSQDQSTDDKSILYNRWFFDPPEKCKINKTTTLNDTGQNISLWCLKCLQPKLIIYAFANSILVLSTCVYIQIKKFTFWFPPHLTSYCKHAFTFLVFNYNFGPKVWKCFLMLNTELVSNACR